MMYFLSTGIFVGWDHPRLYFTFPSIREAWVLKESDDYLKVAFSANEPFYKTKKLSKKEFCNVSRQTMEAILEYLDRHGVHVEYVGD